jgi:putative DNA primase/helicase
MTTEEVLGHFSGVEPQADGSWKALCPAHDDDKSSLHVTSGANGKTLMKCHAGCEMGAIVRAAGITVKDLFVDDRKGGKREGVIVAEYNYLTAEGKVLFQAVRLEPKGFYQRRPTGNGNWIDNLKGVDQIPYRLPHLLKADSSETVFIPEGEKDVENLVKMGLLATCNAGGAGKWKASFAQYLAGRHVVILPDNDEAGRDHARKVARSLVGKSASIKVVELPGLPLKGDVTNWIEAGGTSETLAALVAAADEWQPEDISIPPITDPEGRTEAANAKRLVAAYGSRVRFCWTWQKPLVWDDRRWKVDDCGETDQFAKSVARELWSHVERITEKKDATDAITFISKSNSRSGISNMQKLAWSEPGIPVLPRELDQNAWMLNCPNGTVDLRTGRLLPFNQADKITKLCVTEYHPEADSTEWERFIRSILPDEEVVTFIQRFLGYCLTGDVSEQILVIFWGSGSNGKSTLLNAILDVLGGDYGIKCDKKLIVSRQANGHSTELMDLFGKRFVITSETEDGEKLAESQIKDLTGGEVIRGRRMREDSWEYSPTHKLVLATNHRPEIMGTDHAIWRRLRLIPFTQKFSRPDDTEENTPDAPRCDPKLGERLAAVKPGILAWMVRGCVDWQNHGLPAPETIVAATKEYRSEQDRLKTFIDEKCLVSPLCRVRSSSIYGEYQKWAEAIGEAVMSQAKFSRRMKEQFTVERSNGAWFIGIGLREDSRDPDF